jgi:hypothetical protein
MVKIFVNLFTWRGNLENQAADATEKCSRKILENVVV